MRNFLSLIGIASIVGGYIYLIKKCKRLSSTLDSLRNSINSCLDGMEECEDGCD